MTVLIGLTGSIGMGKSTAAEMFVTAGCALWDADAAVHRLYAPGGAAAAALARDYPEAIEDDAVSRSALRQIILRDPQTLKRIESIIHPLVAEDRARFIAEARASGQDCVVLDIPLLFETGIDQEMDVTVVVSAPPELQRARVLERGTMTEAEFDIILKNQMSDADKRSRADYVMTSDRLEHTREQVQAVLADIRRRQPHA
ncbi:MAG: dephospho-CoA kinase [Rhodobacteraceae bacterium CG17_big_fil_post_rev_8_21_14_2_50_63_15]|nr:dephospho-CoA kinase [Roseovarius sp.]PIV78378.1 MAG: dephospho-CoA kinase [Rhodobacteraceae bacterium CG17_big_fil_post_rev_8_21_14_2_50_63_15]